MIFGKVSPPTPATGPDSDTDLAIAVSEAAVGVVSANAFAGLASPAGRVFAQSNWTPLSTKYFAASDYRQFVAQTASSQYRDMEVDTWMRDGVVFLRLAGGRAIYFYHNGETLNGTLTIGIVTGLRSGVGFLGRSGTFTALYMNSNLAGTVAGYDRSNTTGDVFTFGVSGLDVYAKLNDVEFVRIKDIRHLSRGAAALQANNEYGFRDVAIRLKRDASIPSDTGNLRIDVRDLGLKALQAVGSITAASNQLTLVSNPGFVAGDSIIVEIGGEAGAGQRGTAGVGGTWPALSYANTTAMNADTSQINLTYSWDRSDGTVYQWTAGSWAQVEQARYYTTKAVPKALCVNITAIDGLVLTLSATATASATGAAVYFDNAALLAVAVGTHGAELNSLVPAGVSLIFPSGSFAFSQTVTFFNLQRWSIVGVDRQKTVIFSPKGVPSQMLQVVEGAGCSFRDLTLRGNARDNGFGLNVTETNVPQGSAFPCGILFSLHAKGLVIDCKFVDVFQDAVGASYSTDVWARQCLCEMNDGLRQYVQWMFQWSDSVGGGFVDCQVTSPTLIAGFEIFRSTGTSMIRPKGINAVISLNSAGNWLVEDADITVRANSQAQDSPSPAFSANNPIINVNTNILPPENVALGGTIRRPKLTQLGFINASKDVLQGIVVNESNPNVTIEGTYPTWPGPLGLITLPNWASPSELFGAVGVNSTGANTVVDGIRVIGTTSGHGNIDLNGAGSVARNCVADSISAPTTSNNMNNSAWAAQKALRDAAAIQ